ncbi:TetR/AcrR family transcriptional regulator [Pedobacter hiemivivus]|uniref:TetR/AcrR family transcriptional regulator n=1 Tax=Pedobacter hiemivivus TaxID=2530454 RepID=A0A4U1GEP3_9SPHI|nr:TetR/AcrR family transcriptional regulator [Pedobacter hiemivivus]TKC62408.1 TetR/AcrR family transcriptional regulator [Pedobacter hiemivivus]
MKNKRFLNENLIKPLQHKRNKELTKRLFIDAALEIVRSEGFKKLGVNKVAYAAGRSKRMLYDYFGGMEGLIKELLKETDHWLSYEENMEETIKMHKSDHGRELASLAMKKHFHQMYSNPLLKELGLLELSDEQNFMSELAERRERLADQLFSISEDYFKNSDVHFRSLCALLAGGINYLILHSKTRRSPYCGVDINDFQDQKRLMRTIELITNSAYEFAKENN